LRGILLPLLRVCGAWLGFVYELLDVELLLETDPDVRLVHQTLQEGQELEQLEGMRRAGNEEGRE
jgi:hypothetical protein